MRNAKNNNLNSDYNLAKIIYHRKRSYNRLHLILVERFGLEFGTRPVVFLLPEYN